jgi:hypothetical protein
MKVSGLAIRSDQPHILGGDSGRLLADKHDQLTAKHLLHHGYPQIELHLIFDRAWTDTPTRVTNHHTTTVNDSPQTARAARSATPPPTSAPARRRPET